jgi:hypothetical protein
MVTDEDRKAAADFMCAPSTDSDLEVLAELLARHRIAAEQRGYQQGIEEAAGVADEERQVCHERCCMETAENIGAGIRAKAKEKNDG